MTSEKSENYNRSLLVATWGKPWGWKQAEYKSPDTMRQSEKVVASSVTEYLLRTQKPERVVIFMLDTVASSFLAKEPAGYDYTRLKELVEREIRKWAYEQELYSLYEYMKKGTDGTSRLKLEIVPGQGRYSGWSFGVFRAGKSYIESGGPMASFYSESFHVVLRELLSLKPKKVIVDISHGINYTTVLLHKAVEFAVDVYLLSYPASVNENILVDVYNSEPLPIGEPAGDELPMLNVHRVYTYERTRDEALSRHLKPDISYHQALERFYLINSVFQERSLEEFSSLSRKLTEHVKPLTKFLRTSSVFIKSFYYSFPLATIIASHELIEQTGPSTENMSSAHGELESNYVSSVLNTVEQVRKIRDEKTLVNFEEKIVAPALIFVNKKLEQVYLASALQSLAWTFYQPGKNKEEVLNMGVNIDVLTRLLDSLYPHTRLLAKNELSKIKQGCVRRYYESNKNSGHVECPLREDNVFTRREWPVQTDCPGNLTIDKRNLLAHGGFEKNVTQLLISPNGKILLRYIPGCWKRIKSVITSLD